MVMWYWSADTLFWQLSFKHKLDVQYQRCTHGNSAMLLFFKALGLAYRRTDSHMTSKIFEIDELPNFNRYGASAHALELHWKWIFLCYWSSQRVPSLECVHNSSEYMYVWRSSVWLELELCEGRFKFYVYSLVTLVKHPTGLSPARIIDLLVLFTVIPFNLFVKLVYEPWKTTHFKKRII